MKHERDLILEVVNWPRFCQRAHYSINAELIPSEERLREHVRDRYGEGELRKIDENRWEYHRRMPGPATVWRILAAVLNKSYA